MRHSFETSQWVPFPIERVFAFFSDPDNLPRLMPGWQHARIDQAQLVAPMPASGNPRAAGAGSKLTITFRALPLLPVRLTWHALISEFAWNDHFCDEQTSGPLAYWRHCHHISAETRDGVVGSRVTDSLVYALPLGVLGDIANAVAIRYQMKAMFAFRQRRLVELLSAERIKGTGIARLSYASARMENSGDLIHLKTGARAAVRLACLFAIVKLLLHIVVNLWETHTGWGYFRDEMYYILCGQHLDWGYVDHGPIVALQARVAILLFGKSLTGIRMLSACAGAMKVFLTGVIAWQMGARRAGQVLAMAGVLLAPEYLALDSFLSMNSFEAAFWMTAAFAILRLVNGGDDRWWIVFGLAAGFGLENKPSMLVFLIALLVGLLLTPQRRILASRAMVIAIILVAAIELPNLLWQMHHHWATLEFLHNGKADHKNVTLSPLAFLHAQELMLSPVSLPLWLAGLAWLLVRPRGSRFRFFGFAYLLFLALMMATRDAKDYYLAPIYPLLFAAGGCAWEALLAQKRTRWIVPAYAALLVVSALLILPMSLPILPPQPWIAYASTLHLRDKSAHSENTEEGPLPQFYADRFGWQEEVDEVTRIYRALPEADRTRAGILCSNYGEASAINFLGSGRGLPFATSGHNNYYLWGPHGETGEVMIVVTGGSVDDLRKNYDSVEVAGRMDHPYAMPYEHRNIYICRGRKSSLIDDWAEIKHYI